MNIVKIKRQQPNVMVVTWVINNICDRSCSYCPAGLHNGSNHHYDWALAKQFWQQLVTKYENIHVSIAGGEPSLSPHLPEAIDIIHDSNNSVGITSNLTRTERYFKKIAPKLSYLAASYHPSSPDEKFVDKAHTVSELTPTTARIMMDSRHWDHSVDVYERLTQVPQLRVEPVRILDWEGGRNPHVYSKEQEQWLSTAQDHIPNKQPSAYKANFEVDYLDSTGTALDTNANQQILQGATNYQGWSCSLGLESLFIKESGAIRKANCHQGSIIGNINRPHRIQWPTAPEVCEQSLCHCVTDIMMTKEQL